MSVAALLLGGLIKPKSTVLTTTAQTDVFTAEVGNSNARTIVLSAALVNDSAGAITVTLEWWDTATNYKWFKRSVPANDTVFVDQLQLMLLNGYKIKATASAQPGITVTLSIIQDSGALGGMLRAQI
jgi:hypothetical protein